MTDRTETRKVQRGNGTLTVRITYTPRQGKPVRLYRLKIEVTESEGLDPAVQPTKVFVYQRATAGAPMADGSPRDEFVCVADELDEDEIPVDNPDLERNVPYYRVAAVELLFRNSDLMYETVASILQSLSAYCSANRVIEEQS